MRHPDHTRHIRALARIEGQVRGIRRMIEERRYCMDVLMQIGAVRAALARVADDVLAVHLDHCVRQAFEGRSEEEKKKKIQEIIKLLKTYGRK